MVPHRVASAVPVIEVAHNADPPGVGSPDRKIHPRHALQFRRMGSELLIVAEVSALTHQVQIVLAQGRWKAIRVLDLQRLPLPVNYPNPIRKQVTPPQEHRFEEAIRVQQRHWLAVVGEIDGNNRCLSDSWEKDAHRHGGPGSDPDLMRAQYSERITVLSLHDGLDLFNGEGWQHQMPLGVITDGLMWPRCGLRADDRHPRWTGTPQPDPEKTRVNGSSSTFRACPLSFSIQ